MLWPKAVRRAGFASEDAAGVLFEAIAACSLSELNRIAFSPCEGEGRERHTFQPKQYLTTRHSSIRFAVTACRASS